jgi:hypothetical protein
MISIVRRETLIGGLPVETYPQQPVMVLAAMRFELDLGTHVEWRDWRKPATS